jgi:hypothetical protein
MPPSLPGTRLRDGRDNDLHYQCSCGRLCRFYLEHFRMAEHFPQAAFRWPRDNELRSGYSIHSCSGEPMTTALEAERAELLAMADELRSRAEGEWSSELRHIPAVMRKAAGTLTRLFAPVEQAGEVVAWQPIRTCPTSEAILVRGGGLMYPIVANWSGRSDESWWLDGEGDVHVELDHTPTEWISLKALEALPTWRPAPGFTEGFEVKPLRWDNHPDDAEWYSYDHGYYQISDYIIYRSPASMSAWCLKVRGHLLDEDFSSPESAKAAAQADYEQRISSAIASLQSPAALPAPDGTTTGWQDISTAPKDRAILAIRAEYWTPVNGDNRWVYSRVRETIWLSGSECFDFGIEKQPTHWMPIPPAPPPHHAQERG